jgi:hypothetical protein
MLITDNAITVTNSQVEYDNGPLLLMYKIMILQITLNQVDAQMTITMIELKKITIVILLMM